MREHTLSNLAIVSIALTALAGFIVLIVALLRDVDIRVEIRPKQ